MGTNNMRTVIEVDGFEDTVNEYVLKVLTRESSRVLVDEDIISKLVFTVDELEDGPRDILALSWADVTPAENQLFYQIVGVDDSIGTTRLMLAVDHKLNRLITQVETGGGWKTYTHLGFSGNRDDFLDWMCSLGISKENTLETFSDDDVVEDIKSIEYSELCIQKYESGSTQPLIAVVKQGLEKPPHLRSELENKMCDWYRNNASNGEVIVKHADELHARIARVLDKL